MRIRVWVTLVLVAALALGGCTRAERRAAGPERVQPLLLTRAAESPDETVPLIVQTRSVSLDPVAAAVQARGGRVTERWDFISALAAELPARAIAGLAGLPGIKYISWDAPVSRQGGNTGTVNSDSVQTAYPFAIGADRVWAMGNYGSGVTVAILDSGLAPQDGASQDFGYRFATANIHPRALLGNDPYGHGTYVAGIIAGDGKLSNQAYVGIAPRSFIFSVRVSDDQGQASTSDLVRGLAWVHLNYKLKGIKVVNISMQSSVQMSYLVDPVDAAVEQLWNAGLVVVVSAGNNGGQACSVCYSPANDPFVITVGAVADQGTPGQGDDALAGWSSRGTTQDGFAKPDLFAPGSHIWSTLSAAKPTPVLAQMYPANVSANGYYIMLGGTSAAAPMVSGAVALLFAAHPTWTPDQVKWVLTNTTAPIVGQPAGLNGELRIDSAINYAGTPPSANAGLAPSGASTDPNSPSNSTVQWSTVQWSTSGDY